jgi:hypothetical protein
MRSGIPVTTGDFLRVYESGPIDYMTAAVLKPGTAELGTETEWRAFREGLQRTLIPGSWEAPERCEAVVHIAGHEVAVVLTPFSRYARRFVGGLMLGGARGEQPEPTLWRAACEAVAAWLLSAAAEGSARIERLRIASGPDSAGSVTVFGQWGRGQAFLWSVGAVHGDRFVAELPLSEA